MTTADRIARARARHEAFHVAPADWCPACRAIAALPSDEPCRCGHPESAHTELGCGAPTNYGGGWAIDSPCTCGFYQIEDDPNA